MSDERHIEALPHAEGPEKSVLAVIMQEPERLEDARELTPDHFYKPSHRTLFEVITDRLRKGDSIELVSLVQHLLDKGLLEKIGGPGYVAEINSHRSADTNFQVHIGELRDKLACREALKQAKLIEDTAWQAPTLAELQQVTEKAFSEISKTTTGAKSNGFSIVMAGDMEGVTEAQDFVEGLLTEGGASLVYGPSNCGKSFWVLDLGASVATGNPFRDELEADQGAVVYVALEGQNGARNRIEAMKRQGRIPKDSPLFLCFSPVSLLEPGHAAKLAETVKSAAAKSDLPCRLVIIDTLARAMAGGDENKGADMTEAVKTIDALRAATGAHVLIVHHCGKNEALGARGHSSLRAAVDTEIEVSRPEGTRISTVRVTKQRDLPPGGPMPFSLNVVELGTDRRGNPITSCVVKHEDSIMAEEPRKAGRKVENQPEDILSFLPQPSTTAWKKAADTEKGVSKSTFYRLLKQAQKDGKARQSKNGFWNLSNP